MSDIIHLLPDSVANQIAAGEVIQRPASVVKELVENSLDAGASHVDVLITEAGKTCIQVIDNGKGMSETDARLSFERHATSKIKEANDLFALRTMGFRGEALASIAAVAQVELKTRQAGQDVGTLLTIEGSRVTGQEATACAEGSNFSVKNLFFNIPARRKFLKSNSTELSNILTEFERIVLVNPECSFSFHHNGVEMHNLPAVSLKQRIEDVFGRKNSQNLLSLEVNTQLVKVYGFVGKPESSKKKGAHQFFFVNGRFMRHPYFHKAVMEAYDQLIPVGEQVSYFLYFEVDPSNIDVNIHPTKTEIKFENEQAIWPILQAAVKETLGRFNEVPSIDFDTVDCPDIPVFDSNMGGSLSMPEVRYNPSYNPFEERSGREASNQRNWGSLYEGAHRESSMSSPKNSMEDILPFEDAALADSVSSGTSEEKPVYIQHKGRFIVTSLKSGLMMVDQHRAHIRILYEKYLVHLDKQTGTSQGLLFPEMIQFSPSESVMIDNAMSDLQALGFGLASLGGGTYSIDGVPSGTEGLQPAVMLRNVLDELISGSGDVKTGQKEKIALSLAKLAAIPVGQALSQKEMDDLVGRLLALPTPNYTPDGKPVLHLFTENDVEKLF